MTEILNSELNCGEVDQLFNQITSAEMELTSGGITLVPLLGRNGTPIQLSTFYGTANSSTTTYHGSIWYI